jgi:hypothetical protein
VFKLIISRIIRVIRVIRFIVGVISNDF